MAKAKNDQVQDAETVVDAAPVVPVVPVVPAKLISFEQWARLRGVKPHHMAGMKAHCASPTKPRTKETWDSLFENY